MEKGKRFFGLFVCLLCLVGCVSVGLIPIL